MRETLRGIDTLIGVALYAERFALCEEEHVTLLKQIRARVESALLYIERGMDARRFRHFVVHVEHCLKEFQNSRLSQAMYCANGRVFRKAVHANR